MTEQALQLLRKEPGCADLLRAYEQAPPDPAPDAAGESERTGWSPRLRDVPGIDDACLAPMHGKLIAHGLLNFRMTDRSAGVVYRLSPDGRDALKRFNAVVSDQPVETSIHPTEDEFPSESAA